ncbi:MAG: hypothetical protein GY816_11145, partial [Cytophagales bacterium]|nr:hypothetical protein [Cytophagales bacterium]
PVTGTSETVSGLSPGTNYYYRLEAVGSAVTSSHSIAEAAYTTISAPTANPTSNDTYQSFQASWSSVSGAVSYELDVSTDVNFGSFVGAYFEYPVASPSTTVNGLNLCSTYYYRVRTVGPNSTSDDSNPITVTKLLPTTATLGTLTSDGNSEICPFSEITFTFSPGALVDPGLTYLEGEYNGSWHNYGSITAANTITVHDTEKFRVRYQDACNTIYSTELNFTYKTGCNFPSSLNKNFVRTEVPRVPISDEVALSQAGPDEKSMSYAYSDGLGRPTQSVAVGAGVGFSDVYSFNVYEPATGRQEKQYMPYLAEGGNNGAFVDDAVNTTTTFYQTELGESKPWSETEFENASSSKVVATTGVGAEWHDNNKNSGFDYYWNDGTAGTFDILKWEVEDFSADPTDESDKPKSTGTYNTANTLRFTQSTSVEGIVTRTATDLRGRKVVSQVLYEGNWISTYTVYDDFNRVRFIIPPVAAEFAKSADLTDDQISGFLFQSIYDEYGRTIKSKAPGAGWNYQVYDEWGRPVLSQDAAQRVNNLWSFVKYDDWNREIMTGEKTYSSKTHENLINDFKEDVNTHERYEIKTSTSLGYTLDRTLPVVSENKILTVHYYDDYSFLTLPNWDAEGNDFTYDPTSGDVTLPATNDITIVGEATGSKVRILSNSSKSNPNNHSGNQWLNTILYLDDDGRIIQTIGENHLGGIDRISNQLNWQGQLDKMKVEHSTDILSAISLDIITRNIYDDHGNLVESYQKIGSDPEVLVGQYVYNKFGELVEKNLHSTDGGLTFLQSLDYSYTIRGWLDQINNAALTDDGTDDAAEDDLVGANYHYTTGTTVNGQTIPGRYDGSMVALEYSAKNDPSLPPSGGTQGGITAYEYDDQNRLSNTVTDAGAFDMSATYDENGNIQTLDRKSAGTLIDDLDYNYDVASNQLLDVSDQGGTEEGYSNFLPGTTTPVDIPDMEYAYDEAGNQTEDQNKGILVMGYNKFQRVDYIEFSDDTKIKNTYDASGNKLAKSVYDADDNLIGQVDYVGAIEYYNGEINQVMTDEGRAYKQNGGYFYEYFIRDHQMNNRLSFGVLPYRKVFLATMETERIPTETQDFAIDPSTRVTLNNHTPLGNESAKLNAVQSRMVGPAIALIISNGDHVDIEAYAKYTDGNWNASTAAGIAGAVVNALSGTPGGLASEASAALTNTLGAGTAAGLFSEAASTTEPDAYLQYMFFDDNYTFVRAGFIGVSPAGFGKYERLEITNGFDALQDGFLYIYVANETNKDQEVYFDDLKVTHESATANFKVSQINDFYPFGMPTTNSWRNEAYIDPGLLYQSSYAHYDSLTGYYDFLSRSYDPQLGRFFAMDPAGQFSSPYTGMGNVPQLGVDPDGESFIGALVLGALLFTETGYEVQKYILPVAVHVDLHLSSEQKGIGLDASVGIPKVIPVSYRAHAGATYYWEHYDDSYKGWETRHGGEWTFGGVVSFSGTTYNSGETSQTTNMITIGGPLANFKYENDFMFGAGEFFPGVPAADGGDRYRTAAARLKIGLFKAGFNLFTGDPGLDSDMRETFDDPDNDDRETYMASNGNDPDKYRAGVFYVGFGPFKIGRNSERIRNKIQNEGAHDAIGAPYFRWLNINPKWYLYLGSGTGNSLW